MEDLDLDIQNYDLEDILNVFKLDYKFTEKDLKSAYRKALKTHPDKSGLNKDVFLFFKKAYDIVSKVFYFRNRQLKTSHNSSYTAEVNEEHGLLLKKIEGKTVKQFNNWFNEMFEKTRVSDGEDDTGYGDWYENHHDPQEKNVSLQDFGNAFEKRKKECKALVVKKDLTDMCSQSGYSLNRDGPTEYSSEIFSKLQYEDLKKAHTETVVPVTMEDFENTKKFKTVDSYRRFRADQNTGPLSLHQSRDYLKQRSENSAEVDSRRIYSILKRDEEIAKKNERWWGHLKQLDN
jgi:hypothetical protein